MARTKQNEKYTSHALAAFAKELIANGGNGAQAVRTLYPDYARDDSSLRRLAHNLRKQKLVQELLADTQQKALASAAAAIERYGLTADNTAETMARLAMTDLRQVVDWGSEIDPKTKKRTYWLRVRDAIEIDPDAHKALVSIEKRADGSLKVSLADKRAALMDLARLKGWVQDKPTDTSQAVQLIIQR